MRHITIVWDPPRGINQLRILNGWNDYGLYQIYGHHPTLGVNTLLYIGKAEGETFKARFNDHPIIRKYGPAVRIRVGRIVRGDYAHEPKEDLPDWRQLLRDAEALLIYHQKPPENTMNINKYNGQPLLITNTGDRGNLADTVPSPPTTRRLQ
jgi:hypothetical protein